MNPKTIRKIAVDIAMTLALLLLMIYERIGGAAHEWIGIGMFALFVIHHILNGKWSRNLRKGKYAPLRVIQTAVVALILLCMLGSMVSGMILSRHALSFLPIRGGNSFARKLHMLSAYWGFVLMSLHLGFHWSRLMGMAKRLVKTSSEARKWVLRGIAALIAGCGAYAFVKRGIGSYMLLKNQFALFSLDEPTLWYLLDYTAAMGLFVIAGHYLSEALKRNGRKF